MSQTSIPEFAETELWVVRSTLKERYGHDIELRFADTEVQTDAYDEIGDAVIGVLHVEADHVRKTKIKVDTAPAKTADAAPDKSDLSPIFWGD